MMGLGELLQLVYSEWYFNLSDEALLCVGFIFSLSPLSIYLSFHLSIYLSLSLSLFLQR